MTKLFPNSNLSTSSQPWGREVEKRLVNLDLTVKSNEINNSARDIQLANSLTRVNSALLKAQTAIDSILSVEEAVYYPGTTEIDGGNIRANTIAANKISAGELIGFDIKTATTGQRVQMASNRIDFYDSLNTYAGGMFGTSSGLGAAIEISGNLGVSGTAGFNGAVTMLTGLSVTGTISGTTVTAGSFSTTGAISAGSLSTTAGINATGSINTDGGLTRTVYAGGGTTGASINNNGTIIRTTSSARYKQDISLLEFNYEDVIALEPKKFRLKEEVADNNEARYYAGFIAEELAETSLDIFV